MRNEHKRDAVPAKVSSLDYQPAGKGVNASAAVYSIRSEN